MQINLKKSLAHVTDSLFPVLCLSCQKELSPPYVCSCPVSGLTGSLCPVCDARTPYGIISKVCRRKTKLKRFFVSSKYQEQFPRDLLHAVKYDFATIYARTISEKIKQTLLQCSVPQTVLENPKQYLVIPVPLFGRKKRGRGFNQTEILGREIAEFLKIEFDKECLVKTKETLSQSSLEKEKRKENVSGVFEVDRDKSLKRKTILLIDDVYTSGATMEECAHILKRAKAREVWGIVFAKG